MKLHPRVPAAAAAPSVDVFDRLPDDVVVRVLDLVSDVRSLARCRCLNRRFATLVTHAEHLHVAVDAVVSTSSSAPFFFSSSPTGSGLLFLIVPLLHRVLFSLLNSISALLYDDHKPPGGGARVVCGGARPAGDEGRHGTKGGDSEPPTSPSSAALLRQFRRVRTLRIELPSGDRPRISSKGAAAGVLRWRAVFGSRLRSCVILAARAYGPMVDEEGGYSAADVNHHEGDNLEEEEQAAATGLKERVIWTIGALIAASARHHMVREVVLGEKGEEMDELVVADRDREGVVMMAREGLGEWRKDEEKRRHEQQQEDSSSSSILLADGDDPTVAERKGRTTVPAVRMTMRHVGRVDLGGGVQMRGAALVVVRAVGGAAPTAHHSGLAAAAAAPAPELLDDDKALVEAAFSEDDELMTAAKNILKRPSYLLEMNSF